jgi:hypothetical protein
MYVPALQIYPTVLLGPGRASRLPLFEFEPKTVETFRLILLKVVIVTA